MPIRQHDSMAAMGPGLGLEVRDREFGIRDSGIRDLGSAIWAFASHCQTRPRRCKVADGEIAIFARSLAVKTRRGQYG